jgi:hypothetical protein
MRQDRERETGNQKHSQAEHRVRIFDGHTSFLVRFGLWWNRKGFFTPQLLHFCFFLSRSVHLPVPSGILARCGKKILEISPTGLRITQIVQGGSRRGTLEQQIREINAATAGWRVTNR